MKKVNPSPVLEQALNATGLTKSGLPGTGFGAEGCGSSSEFGTFAFPFSGSGGIRPVPYHTF